MSYLRLLLSTIIIQLAYLMPSYGQDTQNTTYCNPINIDYTYMIYNAHKNISYRSGADPAVVRFRNEYYMFVTRSMGYWHSKDLLNWSFIKPRDWYFEGSNAPAAFNYRDSILYVTGNPSGSMSILYTDNPKKGDWHAVPSILSNLQDPCFFIDDDDQAYVYWGSSNLHPIRGRKLDIKQRFKPDEEIVELIHKDEEKHGWERFGDNNYHETLKGYIEGPWITKYNDTYYLQYGAPGTEFNVYSDGVYTSDSPLGPYSYAPNNPISLKPGGFMNGAGHGSLVLGPQNTYWHFATMALSVNINWERRIAMFPTYFDREGFMYSDTYFGDYPHFAPSIGGKQGVFTGWMLLSYKKPIKAFSTDGDYSPKNMVDENSKTYWLAKANDDQQWITIDLEKSQKVYAIQINYQDHQSNLYGKVSGLYHRYRVEGSEDGQNWETLVDRSNSYEDVPNDYVELGQPQMIRYLKYTHIHATTPHLAISGFRVFGKGQGKSPSIVKGLNVKREEDRRNASIIWDAQDVQGYNVLWGIAEDKLYNSWMVYDNSELKLRSLTVDQEYFFSIEAFDENGVSERTKIIKVN